MLSFDTIWFSKTSNNLDTRTTTKSWQIQSRYSFNTSPYCLSENALKAISNINYNPKFEKNIYARQKQTHKIIYFQADVGGISSAADGKLFGLDVFPS